MTGRQFYNSFMFLSWGYASLVGFVHPELARHALLAQALFVYGSVIGTVTAHSWRDRMWGRR